MQFVEIKQQQKEHEKNIFETNMDKLDSTLVKTDFKTFIFWVFKGSSSSPETFASCSLKAPFLSLDIFSSIEIFCWWYGKKLFWVTIKT